MRSSGIRDTTWLRQSVLYGSTPASKLFYEMDDLNNQDAMLGYRLWVTWGALEPTQGHYNFSALDTVLARLKTQYNKPKRMVIGFWLYGQGNLGQNDGSVIPLYIQQNSAYGASPVAGSYGWWGKNSNGQSTGMYAPALYTPAVMNRFIALVQALANHYDSDPNVEAVYFPEDATHCGSRERLPTGRSELFGRRMAESARKFA